MISGKLTGSWAFLIGLGLVATLPGCTSELSDSLKVMDDVSATDDDTSASADSETSDDAMSPDAASPVDDTAAGDDTASDPEEPTDTDAGGDPQTTDPTSDTDTSSTDDPTTEPADDPTDVTDDDPPVPVDSDDSDRQPEEAGTTEPTLDPTDDPTTEPTDPTTTSDEDSGTGPGTEPTTSDPTTSETTIEEDSGTPEPPAEPLEVLQLVPEQDAMDADTAANLVITFGAPISLGTGTIEIVDLDADAEVESISVADARVSLTEDSVSIDLDSILMGGTAYSVTVPAGAFAGSGGEVFEGATWSFQTAAISVPGDVSASDLLLWFDADYAASVKAASNALRLWADRSGHRNNLLQATSGKRPTLVSNSLGGNPVVRFDGSDDFLLGPNLDDPSAYDLFIVWRSPSVPSEELTLLVTNGVLDTCNLQMTYGHSFAGYEHSAVSEFGETFESAAFAAPAADTGTLWNSSLAAGGPLLAYTNGAQTTSTAISGDLASAEERFALAANDQGDYNFGGDVAEILLFSRALSSGERDLVEEYLGAKWGLTLAE